MPHYPVSSQVRHHLFLAVREALANILKHSASTRAIISMECENENLKIRVVDNGKGFDSKGSLANGPYFKEMHDGLRNMTKRFADVGGQCSIESTVGSGTKITFILPLKGAKKDGIIYDHGVHS
jgi:signal transduction histidine kinase